jgi:hypothetical protein
VTTETRTSGASALWQSFSLVRAPARYARALSGEIKGFTGIDDPYEPPLSPEVVVHTDRESPGESLVNIVRKLEALGYLRSMEGQVVPGIRRSQQIS